MKKWIQKYRASLVVLFLAGILLIALSGCSGGNGSPGPAGQQGLQGAPGPAGPAGVGISNASINTSGHLMITLSDGKTLDAGNVASTQNSATAPASTVLSMGDLFTQVQPVIARIEVSGATFQASGSGIIIRSDGYVITNQHVIDNTTSINVTLNNNQQYTATIIAQDSNIDLAIIKLANIPPNLPVVNMGTASDIAIGGVVIAAGFPLGPILEGPPSFTQGIISAERIVDGQKYIQSDVQINPGSSGGALLSRTTGKLLGITTAGLVPPGQDAEGIGLAIPIDIILTYIQNNLK
jgi:serine protease Do